MSTNISNYDYLTLEENSFIQETEKLFEGVKSEFANEIKIAKTLAYDCERIQISRDFLEATIKLRDNSINLGFDHKLSYFTEYEFKTHQEIILVILCRIYDDNKLSVIKNKIIDKPNILFPNSISKLYAFFENQQNFDSAENIRSIFPNFLRINYINSNGKNDLEKLENLYKENIDLFNILKIREEYRNSYLSHHDLKKNISFWQCNNYIYLNLKFQELLDKTLEFIQLVSMILSYTTYGFLSGISYSGDNAQIMFDKIEKALILETEIERKEEDEITLILQKHKESLLKKEVENSYKFGK